MTTSTADRETAVRVLTAAFADDPVSRWLLPHDLPDAAARVFGPLVELSAAQGELAVSADGAAVAVWLPRGAEPPPEGGPLPDRLARLRTFMELTEQRHPAGHEHLYLVFLGVAPGAQCLGHGGALLRERLARADADRVPAYLEASSPRTVAFYERHGFRLTGGPLDLPDGPAVWPMWREPRP